VAGLTDQVAVTQEPFNAEPARRDLAASYITPVDLFFKRNHGPIPVLDDIDRFAACSSWSFSFLSGCRIDRWPSWFLTR
jgi:hypothetical protein